MKEEYKKNRLEVMLDLETTGIEETSGILEMSLMPFHLDGKEVDMEPFHRTIDLVSCFMEGMTFDKSTQRWWMKQDAKARFQLRRAEKTDIRKAIKEAHEWLTALCGGYEVHVWCRGLNFDIPKFERCVRTLIEEDLPYKWWNLEDARTFSHAFDVHSSDIEFQGTPHCAADDCRHQIAIVQQAYMRKVNLRSFAQRGIIACHKNDREALQNAWKKTFGTYLSEEELSRIMN